MAFEGPDVHFRCGTAVQPAAGLLAKPYGVRPAWYIYGDGRLYCILHCGWYCSLHATGMHTEPQTDGPTATLLLAAAAIQPCLVDQ
jgi:hypothetical protein